ncbi:MAG TPA: hypothetical protein VEZ11_00605 [Thermoanaerobaculia bacterium]|nr:hypothetical protein [Thermoanaerobaculia bacterium]
MADETIATVLTRIRSQRGCTFAELEDLLPPPYYETDRPASVILRDPVATLMQWGLIEAYQGSVRLTTAELLAEHPNFSRQLSTVKLFISPTAAAIEHALGHNFWVRTESIFGEPLASHWPDLFVLMPFTDELRPVFDDHIALIANRLGLSAGRADDFFSSRSIVHEIWSAIYSAQLVVADCTGRNPNVFYEIGLAHAIGKKTILISQTLDDVPFDLRHLRSIRYEFAPRGMKDFENDLQATIQMVLRSGRPRLPSSAFERGV